MIETMLLLGGAYFYLIISLACLAYIIFDKAEWFFLNIVLTIGIVALYHKPILTGLSNPWVFVGACCAWLIVGILISIWKFKKYCYLEAKKNLNELKPGRRLNIDSDSDLKWIKSTVTVFPPKPLIVYWIFYWPIVSVNIIFSDFIDFIYNSIKHIYINISESIANKLYTQTIEDMKKYNNTDNTKD